MQFRRDRYPSRLSCVETQQFALPQQQTAAPIETPVAENLLWLHDVLSDLPAREPSRPTERAACSAIKAGLSTAAKLGASLHSARLWLKPRPERHYDRANRLAENICRQATGDDAADRRLIDRHIGSQCAQATLLT